MANELSVILDSELTKAECALPKNFNKDRFVHNAIAMLNCNGEFSKICGKEYNGTCTG